MKKFTFFKGLLAAAMLWGATSVANAQQTIVQSFASSETNDLSSLPTVAGEAATYSLSSGQWTLYNCKWYNIGYLMLCKAASPLEAGALTLPTVSFKVGSISVVTGSNASVKVTMSLYAGDELVETKTLDAKGATFTWALSDQTVGTVYKFVVANANNAQFQSVTITEASTSPTVAFKDNNDVEFGTVLNASQTQTVEVLGSNLTDDITVSLSGTDASKFSLSTTTISKEGGSVDVTYTGNAAGSFDAVLNIASGAATANTNLTASTVAHAGTEDDPLTIADVYALKNSTTGKYWVIGTIAGCAANVTESVPTGIDDAYVASNIALTQDGETVAMGVQLPSSGSAIRESLELDTHPENLNRTVMVYGTLENYFGRPGVKSVTDYVLFVDLDENVDYTATTISKANVTLKRTLTAGWNALCVPFSLTAEQVSAAFGTDAKVAELGSFNSETNILSFNDATSITANKPCLLKVGGAGTSYSIEGVSIEVPSNELTDTQGSVNFIGNYTTVTMPVPCYYVNNSKFYTAAQAWQLKGFRAYVTESSAPAKPLNIRIDGDDVTAINGINADENAISGDIYTLGGQLVRKNATTTDGLAKGIYIVNGKKVVVK